MTTPDNTQPWWWLTIISRMDNGHGKDLGRAIVRATVEQAREQPNDLAQSHGLLPEPYAAAAALRLTLTADPDPQYTNTLLVGPELGAARSCLATLGETFLP